MRQHLSIVLAGVALACAAQAQPANSLATAHARVVDIINDTTVYVSEVIQACAVPAGLSEPQAKGRFEAYLVRNANTLERAEAWARDAEAKLKAQGTDGARRRSDEAGFQALDAGAQRARREMRAAPDRASACSAKLLEISTGTHDLSRNAELVSIIGR